MKNTSNNDKFIKFYQLFDFDLKLYGKRAIELERY